MFIILGKNIVWFFLQFWENVRKFKVNHEFEKIFGKIKCKTRTWKNCKRADRHHCLAYAGGTWYVTTQRPVRQIRIADSTPSVTPIPLYDPSKDLPNHARTSAHGGGQIGRGQCTSLENSMHMQRTSQELIKWSQSI